MRVNGPAIRAIREAKGWRLSKFAIACGISHSHMSNIEAGRKDRASAETARRIADVLGVPLAAISSDFSAEEVA